MFLEKNNLLGNDVEKCGAESICQRLRRGRSLKVPKGTLPQHKPWVDVQVAFSLIKI